MEEGGGSTTTYPWERWRYRYLEGIQENVELEFVDPSGSGEYKLTMDPSEKRRAAHGARRRPYDDGIHGGWHPRQTVLPAPTARTWAPHWAARLPA